MDRHIDRARRLLADRAGGVDLCDSALPAVGVATPVDGRLAGGGADSGLRLAAAAVAAGTGDDGADLLSHPPALSAAEGLRQGYV